MSIHAHDHLTTGRSQGSIKAGRDDPSLVVQEPDLRMLGSQLQQILSRAIGRNPISDNDLKSAFRRLLAKNRFQALLDVALLIPAGQNHRNERMVIHMYTNVLISTRSGLAR